MDSWKHNSLELIFFGGFRKACELLGTVFEKVNRFYFNEMIEILKKENSAQNSAQNLPFQR